MAVESICSPNLVPNNHVAMGWHGLPPYAARLIRAVPNSFPVIATRPTVPFTQIDEILPGRIIWIAEIFTGGWAELGVVVPRIFFQPSWNHQAFNRLGNEVSKLGGKVVVLFDNPFRGDFRQIFGALLFRTFWKKRFAAAWVAGNSGKRLAQLFGFPSSKIYCGLYGADPNLFSQSSAIPLSKRPKKFLYVGRLVHDKGISELCEAWHQFKSVHEDWELHVCGIGPLQQLVSSDSTISFHGFLQPSATAAMLFTSRFLVLPSYEEHWGLVVCEAAQAGCGLLLSETVGSLADFSVGCSRTTFRPRSVSSLKEAMFSAAILDHSEMDNIQRENQLAGDNFTPVRWALTFQRILDELTKATVE